MLRPLVAMPPTAALIAGILVSTPAQAAPSIPAERVTVRSSCYRPDMSPSGGTMAFTTRPAPGGTYARARVSGVDGTRWRGGITDYEGDTSRAARLTVLRTPIT